MNMNIVRNADGGNSVHDQAIFVSVGRYCRNWSFGVVVTLIAINREMCIQ